MLAVLALLAGLSLCRQAAKAVQWSVVDFPSATGSSALRRARLSIGTWFSAESFIQPSSFSYWAGASFQLSQSQGDELACRAGIRGWARPQARRGTLLRLVCSCEQPRLHDRQAVPCLRVALSGSP